MNMNLYQMNDLDRCAQNCSILLNADPNNEAASVMMADLAFRKVDFETAAFHFRQLLMRQPTYWTALARLIEVSRRTGFVNFFKILYARLLSIFDRQLTEIDYCRRCYGRSRRVAATSSDRNGCRQYGSWILLLRWIAGLANGQVKLCSSKLQFCATRPGMGPASNLQHDRDLSRSR